MRARHVAAIALLVACGPREVRRERAQAAPPDAGVVDSVVEAAPVPPGPRLERAVTPTAYELTLELDPARPSFDGQVTIDVTLAAPTRHVWLHARDLSIRAVTAEDGGAVTPVPFTLVAERELVVIDLGRPVTGAVRLGFAYGGLVRADDVNGLFRQMAGGAWYLFSQLEAMHARRVLPCFDEPGWKVPWQVTLVVPPGLVAASNAPEAARGTRADGRLEVRFAPTPPMPSYLLAVAVGPFDVVDVGPVGRAAVPARVLVPAGRAADAAVVVAETPRIVAALEGYFDRALPLAKLDSVAVPSFPGAMENLGLVTYASELVLASPARPAIDLRRDHVAVAAHELAHQWFGNLVTMAWWDDLWLNESFATWLADKVVADLDPRRDVVTERRRSRATAMERDLRARAPAMRRAIATAAEADAAFDPLAYDKGAAVLAMFERALGPERFRAAVRAFIAQHAGGSVTAADFAAALGEGAGAGAGAGEGAGAGAGGGGQGADVAAALATFLDQPGAPRVELDLACGDAPAAIATVTRAVPVGTAAQAASWRFPLCVRFPDKARGGAVAERCGWIAGAGGQVELGVPTCPAWLVGAAGGAAYYQVAYRPALAASLRDRLREVPVVDRGTLAAGAMTELATGGLSVPDALAWAERLLAAPDRHDVIAAVELLEAVDGQVGPDLRPRWQAWLRARLSARARVARLEPTRGETAAAATARRALIEAAGLLGGEPALVTQGEAAAHAWLDGRGRLRGEDLGLALRLAGAGRDAALADRLRARLVAETDRPTRRLIASGLAAATTPPMIERAVEVAFTDPLDPYERVELLGELLASPAAADRAWSALASSPSTLATRVPVAAWPLVVAGTEALCTAERRAEVETFFASAAAGDRGTALALADALEAIDDCLARRAHHAAGVAAALSASP